MRSQFDRDFGKPPIMFNIFFYGIGLTILSVFAVMIFGAFKAVQNGGNEYQFGINGISETRCIKGYEFVIVNGITTQVLDSFGKGVACKPPEPKKG